MPRRVRHQNRKGKTEGPGRTEQVGKRVLKPKEEDARTEQPAQREEGRTGAVHGRAGEPDQDVAVAEGANQQALQQRMMSASLF